MPPSRANTANWLLALMWRAWHSTLASVTLLYTLNPGLLRRRRSADNLKLSAAEEGTATIAIGPSSLLHKLPVEIRRLIYKECFSDYKRVTIEPVRQTRGWTTRYSFVAATRTNPKGPYFGKRNDAASRGFLSLPFTCRQLYAELIEDLYAYPTFHFDHPGDIIGFHKSLPARRWACITDIHLQLQWGWAGCGKRDLSDHPTKYIHKLVFEIDDWRQACEAMASLPNLQRLIVDLFWELGQWRQFDNALGPLMQITRPVDFQVRAMRQTCNNDNLQAFRCAPFTLLELVWGRPNMKPGEVGYEPWWDDVAS